MSIVSRYLGRGEFNKLKRVIKDRNIYYKEIDDLYKILTGEYPEELKFLTWDLIRKDDGFLNFEKLKENLNLPESIIKKIFRSNPVKVRFPIALDGYSDLATAYIIPLDKDTKILTFSQNKEMESSLKIIKNLVTRKNPDIKSFFVIFDKDFTGRSFMLAVTAGLLLPQKNIEDFAFTGYLNEKGEIFPVSHISEKEKTTRKYGYKLITPDVVDTVDQLIYWLGDQPVDIPFIQLFGKDFEEALISVGKLEKKIQEKNPFFSLKGLERIFDLKKEDLILHRDGFLPVISEKDLDKENEWIKTVEQFEEKLENIYLKVKNKKRVLHISISIAALAFAFGVKLGTKKPVVLYHYQSDDYYPVIDLSDKNKIRKIKLIKKDIKQYEKIKVKTLKDQDSAKEIAVAIWFASHNPYGDTVRLAEDKGWNVVGIETKNHQGNIPLPNETGDEDYWIHYVSETYSYINFLKNDSNTERFHFFISSPVQISFALGMAVGHFIEGIVYNHNKTTYYPIYRINEEKLRSVF
ncbi:SAVED domain-containing protein [Persephonella sp.]